MGKFIENLGMQAGAGAVGGAMGLILGGYNDERQLRQQEKLQKLQLRGQQEMADYNFKKQLEMWNATNYGAQVEQMKKAGINPGLLYGMSGGGGTTTGGGGAGVTGANAPVGGGEMQAMMGMGIQMQLLKAQKDNIVADTELKKTTAEKTAGVDTKLAQTQVLDLVQGIENKKAQEELTRVQTNIQKIEEEIKGRSKEDVITTIQQGALKAIDEARMALYDANVSEEVVDTKIKMIQTELTAMYLQNAKTAADTELTLENIRKVSEELVQGWHKLNIDFANANTGRKNYELNKWIHNIQDSKKLTVETIKGIVQAILIAAK